MTGHGVRLTDDGRLAVIRSSPPEDADRLRSTIQSLRTAAGAGAVDVVQVTDDAERVEVVLSFAGRPIAPMQAGDLAPLVAVLAGHLSDLHLRGMAHGAVRAEHVLVDADRRVRLCGFGVAHGAQATDDVQAFGALVRTLLHDDDRSAFADALRFHADRCCVDVNVRPTMAAIAASLASVGGPGRTVPTAATATSRRRWPVGVAATTILALGALVVTHPRDSGADDRSALLPTWTTELRTTTTTAVKHPTRVWPASLRGDGSTWNLGDADDRRLLGDWNCDDVETPALVQRPSGAVYVVDEWPDVEVAARYVTTLANVIDVSVGEGEPPSCDRLVVVTDDGRTINVSLSA